MRVKCLHGYFLFDEEYSGEISDFMSFAKIQLVPCETFFTFPDLKDAPKYSLQGKPLIGLNAIVSSEGEPWEVFEYNGFVYDFSIGSMRPILSVANVAKINGAGNRYVANGLIPAGSLNQNGQRVKNYSAWYSRATGAWLYSEVTYV